MKRISFGNRMTPALLAACGLLGAIVAFEWHTLSRQEVITEDSDAQPTTGADVALARATYDAPDYEAYSEILERPLFTEGRTPPPEQAATESATATPKKITPLNLRLEGIALTPEARVAVIRDLASKKMHRLSEGDKHQGWMVESIHATGATLKLGEQTEELTLELDAKSVGKTPVSASAPFRRNLNRRKK